MIMKGKNIGIKLPNWSRLVTDESPAIAAVWKLSDILIALNIHPPQIGINKAVQIL